MLPLSNYSESIVFLLKYISIDFRTSPVEVIKCIRQYLPHTKNDYLSISAREICNALDYQKELMTLSAKRTVNLFLNDEPIIGFLGKMVESDWMNLITSFNFYFYAYTQH